LGGEKEGKELGGKKREREGANQDRLHSFVSIAYNFAPGSRWKKRRQKEKKKKKKRKGKEGKH